MTATNYRDMVDQDEGDELVAYPDPVSGGDPWTIGRGHTGPEVHEGLVWTQAQSDQAFDADLHIAMREVEANIPWLYDLNEARQAVLFGMCFQMGIARLIGFRKALQAMRTKNWKIAQLEMENSAWMRETPDRCKLRAKQMLTGEWQ